MRRTHHVIAVVLWLGCVVTGVGAQTRAGGSLALVNAPFDPLTERVPRMFGGVDLVALARALNASSLPDKGQFETTADFEGRRKGWEQRPILGSITPASTIAVVLPESRSRPSAGVLSYDADRSLLRLSVARSCARDRGVRFIEHSKASGSFVGQNAFGAKARIDRVTRSSLCLVTSSADPLTYSAAVSPADARKVMPALAVALVGSLVPPYWSTDESVTKATLDNPTEVHASDLLLHFKVDGALVFDQLSGTVFIRPKWATAVVEGEEQLDNYGNTLLHLAALRGDDVAVNYVIKRGRVGLDVPNKFGDTALHIAASHNRKTIVDALLRAGAKRDVVNADGQKPVDYASRNGHEEVQAALSR